MPPIEKDKVKIKIKPGTKHFTDEGGRLFAPGTWDVSQKVADRLVAQGKASLVGGGSAPAKPAAAGKGGKADPAPATNPRIPPTQEPEDESPTPLPEDFPSREVLAANGFETIESLKASDVKEKLAAIEGLTPADVTKIGLAISKV